MALPAHIRFKAAASVAGDRTMFWHGLARLWQGQCQLVFEVSQRHTQGLSHVGAVSDRQEFSDHGDGRHFQI
ncbi:hypothetical protein HC62_11020 [Acetobacter tropicalis]|uniref:Uncharacterized protein n=1 Tax=Acetobacter tropicalis TaxID=104102 RepID=A0A252A773_9PROT|nr:hypothetical protein HC62_11020 [Acetobacter tropicalis]